jgi:beta-galactosidase
MIGYSYHLEDYAEVRKNYPTKPFIGSETVSALASRGSYDMPSDSIRRWPKRWDLPFNEGNADISCSSYDNCSAPWGSTQEETWKLVKKLNFVSGQFIWTGMDYLGEPTPYPWPARSSYFGIVDLAGFPKDAYYLYRSEWTDNPVLHIFPHWNWKEGQMVDVWAYTNCEEVELFLNGTSCGTKRKNGDALHLVWRLKYTPGTVKAIGSSQGKELLRQEIKTAGAPASLILEADRSSIVADGRDLSFVTVKVLDASGTVVPLVDNLIRFSVTGEGSLVGVDNGHQTNLESFKAHEHTVFHGLGLAVIQSTEKSGQIFLQASADGLKEASITIQSK